MITEEELLLNNESYINKDFDAVYRELIDIAKNISYRYDPTTSNESDPFIVLVKLLAFATDKVNYNIDKQLLERFLLSATQRESVQDITSRLGYNMHYYIAAQTDVSLTYNPEDENDIIEGLAVTYPRGIVLGTNVDGIQYITLEDVTFTKDSTTVKVPAIQCNGGFQTFTVLSDLANTEEDNTTVTLSNLDENRRLYFSETGVAQNGVFITGGTSISEALRVSEDVEGWQLVDNFNTAYYGSQCYRFNYDSFKELPYLEFPEWIDKIIGAGIHIEYVVCSGSAGNVSARSINTISSIPDVGETSGYTTDRTKVTASNLSAALSGKDPETINEAYQGFKKTIGTFDTLVTCRDYANKIYNLINSNGNNLVSNCQVGDRRDDINYSRNVVEYTDLGVQVKSEIQKEEVVSGHYVPEINASDLVLYPLNPVVSLSFENINSSKGYDNTYERLLNTEEIKNQLEDSKYLTHDYKNIASGDIILLEDIYKLDVVIYTTYKVNQVEAVNIIQNVNTALANNFNSRELEYGYEIPMDVIQEVISAADSRIKMVSLNIPEKKVSALINYDSTTDVIQELNNKYVINDPNQPNVNRSTNVWYYHTVAKNVLSGKAELFDYDENFNYDYDQSDNTRYDSVETISTYPFGIKSLNTTTGEVVPDTMITSEYTLRDNEVIQIASPSLVDFGKTYPYPIKYVCNFSCPQGIHELIGDEYIKFSYTSGGEVKIDKYDANSKGKIINVNFDLEATPNTDFNATPATYLKQGQEIGIQKINEVVMNQGARFYWVVNSIVQDNGKTYYQLNWQEGDFDVDTQKRTYNYVLNEEEYLFYTDSTYSYLSSFGPGTKLTLTGEVDNVNLVRSNWRIAEEDLLSLSDLMSKGMDAIGDKFVFKSFTDDKLLKMLEQEIITLTKDDFIKFDEWKTYPYPISYSCDFSHQQGEFQIPESKYLTFSYTLDGEQITVTYNHQETIRSSFDLISTDPGSDYIRQDQKISVKLNSFSTAGYEIKQNYFSDISKDIVISYKLAATDVSTTVNTLSVTGYSRSIRALLDINCGPTSAQELTYIENSINSYPQTIVIKNGNTYTSICVDTSSSTTGPKQRLNIMFDTLEQLSGGENINLKYTDFNSENKYPKLQAYNSKDITSADDCYFEKVSDNYYTLFGASYNSTNPDGSITLPVPSVDDEDAYVMIKTIGKETTTFDLSLDAGTIEDFLNADENSSQTPTGTLSLEANQTYVLKLSGHYTELTISKNSNVSGSVVEEDQSAKVSLSVPRLVLQDSGESKVNPLLDAKDIIIFLRENYKDQLEKFYAINYIENDKAIELSEDYPLSSSEAFCDYNNIANKWVLAKIDFENSNIRVASTSIKR